MAHISNIFLPLPDRCQWGARLTRLFTGLVLFGIGVALMVRSELGLSPWEVLHQGISINTGVWLGTVGIIIGFVVLLAWVPLRERLGIGTVANIITIGVVIDISLYLLPTELAPPARLPSLIVGITLIGLASSLYIGAGLGPGPRDGLMTGLAKRGMKIGVVRTGLELAVLALGWSMGGTVGVGTLLFAIAVGPIVQFTLPHLSVDSYTPDKKRIKFAKPASTNAKSTDSSA